MSEKVITIDGNEAAARVAYKLSEVIAIYPITPSSPMGELSDAWAAQGQKNLWGAVPHVVEMQSEGGASGAVHGAATTGALTTTFTASQGLLLMLPNMFKIAGELTPSVFHVAARSVAAQALSIFGDHTDVMATRGTGFALMASGSVQEVMDLGLISHASTLPARVPFLHFFDGFRTSHELMKVVPIADEHIRALIDDADVVAHRVRGLSPDHPAVRGTSQNPDVFFQARESVNSYYEACPRIVQRTMDRFAELTGRHYHLFDYVGAPDAERVVVLMGSGSQAAQEAVAAMAAQGAKVGAITVRLYRPFSAAHLLRVLPRTVQRMAVLDRTKEPGSAGEPLFLDVVTALADSVAAGERSSMPRIIGGRYGLSSKEFTPAMVKGVFDELEQKSPRTRITVGINDDVTHTSVTADKDFSSEKSDVLRSVFVGLGSDGTVSANKNSIKIIGEHTDLYAQGFFVYDSKKAGAITVSHLRFSHEPIRSTYLIDQASFVGCHQWHFLERYDVLRYAAPGATLLINSPYGPDAIWAHLPVEVQQEIIDKKLRLWVIDAYSVARDAGMGRRINTVMQTCFFAISGVLPQDEAIAAIRKAVEKSYGRRGAEVVKRNFAAIDRSVENLHEVDVEAEARGTVHKAPVVSPEAPDFVQRVTAMMMAGRGDDLPVSALPNDGTYPVGTTQWEKRNLALEIPVWDADICIQCNKCVVVCPHAAIRAKVFEAKAMEDAPAEFKAVPWRGKEYPGWMYSLQTAPEDCTGCGICVDVCPVKNKTEVRLKAVNMAPQEPLREIERDNYAFFLSLPEVDRRRVKRETVKGSQLLQPLFEYSGACTGCGETPYLKLASQLFGDRMIVANATGCSSIYGGNLPTTPWAANAEGYGVAWSNSLFEDNAEFGMGFRLTIDQLGRQARELLQQLEGTVGSELAQALLEAKQADEAEIYEQRDRVTQLKQQLESVDTSEARLLLSLADYLVKKSVWIVGGDGWAYDIGYGGLDHVLASGRNVNALVLDTEVYSNTGGQMSKATPRGAVAKFAAAGKGVPKKDLGMLAMAYGSVYVAQVAMGANDAQTIKAFLEAEAYDGPSLIIAYSHCDAHGIDMATGMQQHKRAVQCGHWPLYRFNPAKPKPLKLDSKAPTLPFKDYAYEETRYRMLIKSDPQRAAMLMQQAQHDAEQRWQHYQHLASMQIDVTEAE